MNPVSEGFLLATAQIAATLIGLVLVGALFYAETGLRQLGAQDLQAAPYLRAGIRWVVLVYATVLGLSLALIALERIWVAPLFGLLSAAVLAGLVSQTTNARRLSRARPDWLPFWAVWHPWPPTVLTLALPWLLGGLMPGPESYVLSLLLLGSMALVGTVNIVLLTFDLASVEGSADR